jgi:hypothetical protein
VSINRPARAFSVSTTDLNLTAHAGAVLIRAAAHAGGLGTAISAYLRLKERARGLTEAESVLAMTEPSPKGRAVSMTSLSHAPMEHRSSCGASRCRLRR